MGQVGEKAALEVKKRARGVWMSGVQKEKLKDLDAWLRGNRLNPGTTADLIGGVRLAWLLCGGEGSV